MPRDRQPDREYVGYIWKGDRPRKDIKVMAHSLKAAKDKVLAEYGKDYSVSLWNKEDADELR